MHMVGKIWTLLFGALIAASLVGCGQEADAAKTTASSVVVRASPSTVVADGQSTATIRATVRTQDGLPVPGVSVDFATTLGILTPDTATTDDNGVATVAIASSTTGSAEVSANVAGIGGTVKIDFVAAKAQSAAVAKLAIGASKASISANSADSTLIRVAVLDSRNTVIPNVLVDFSSTGGQLFDPNTITDKNGVASISLSSNFGDPSNQVITVTATVGGTLTKFIPIQVTGSTVTVEATTNSLVSDGSAAAKSTEIIVTAKDAGNVTVANVPVTLSVASTGGTQGTATLSTLSGTTDINGRITATVTGVTEGSVEVTAQAIGAKGLKALTISKTQQTFRFTTPETDASEVTLNQTQTYTVAAPTQTTVTFGTTLGALRPATADCTVAGTKTLDVAVASGTASVKYCPTIGGVAIIKAGDPGNSEISDIVQVSVVAQADAATKLTLNAGVYVLPISSGPLSHQTELTAQVTNNDGTPVINRKVWFSVENSTGGGETISPPYGFTDVKGQVKTTFTAGSSSSTPRNPTDPSLGGVIVRASASDTITDSVSIVVAKVAASVVIGIGTKISSVANDTAYKQPATVKVTDANGSAVAGATVSLSVWPAYYIKGHWFPIRDSSGNITDCLSHGTAWIPNPDTNGNLALDGAEVGPLVLPMAAAGSVPQTVQTDADGLGTFDLNYVKGSANWVVDQIVASTAVFGSQSTTALQLVLPAERSDVKACLLADSPYGGVVDADRP